MLANKMAQELTGMVYIYIWLVTYQHTEMRVCRYVCKSKNIKTLKGVNKDRSKL
jgi:hypothetical protein